MKKISITKTGIQEGGEISVYNTVGETRYGYIDKEPKVGQSLTTTEDNAALFFKLSRIWVLLSGSELSMKPEVAAK